jgi:hypothetical protein
MSPNPEQFSIPDTKNIPTAGENPNTAGHLEDIPFDKEPLELHYGEDEKQKVDTGQLAQVQTGEYWSPRPPARELPIAEGEKKKSKRNLFIGLAAATATLLAAGGAMVGATGNGFVKKPGTLPEQTPSASAPLTPGQTTPTFESPAQPKGATPEDIASYEKNVASTVLTACEYKGSIPALHALIPVFESMVNYQPSDAELEKSKSLVSSKTGVTGPLAAAEMYRESFSGAFVGGGEFYGILQKIGAENFDKWLRTKELGDAPENRYTMNFELDENNRLVITDNVNHNSLTDDPVGTVYTITPEIKLDNLTSENQDPEKRRWRLEDAIVTKYGTVPNQ